MLYSRCLYHVLIWTGYQSRAEHPVSQHTLWGYVQHACDILKCNLLNGLIGNGCLRLLIDLNPQVSLRDFISRLKSLTSAWIVGDSSSGAVSYWSNGFYFRYISPEEKDETLANVFSGSRLPDANDFAGLFGMVFCDELFGIEDPTMSLHHIIIVTSRSRLLLPEKYRHLLADLAAEVARGLGAEVEAASSMRNHVHLLARVPIGSSIYGFINQYRSNLLDKMRHNLHFRRFEGWSEIALAYTVSEDLKHAEEHDILNQEMIHWSLGTANEMSHLYRKLSIPYVTSLN